MTRSLKIHSKLKCSIPSHFCTCMHKQTNRSAIQCCKHWQCCTCINNQTNRSATECLPGGGGWGGVGGGSNATDSVSITSSLSLLSFFPGVFYAGVFYIRQLTPSHNAWAGNLLYRNLPPGTITLIFSYHADAYFVKNTHNSHNALLIGKTGFYLHDQL